MAKRLENKKIAVLVTKGFEQIELEEPMKALREEGAEAVLISPSDGEVKAWQQDHWGDNFKVDLPLQKARPEDFDALLLPGGVMNPDYLRQDEDAVDFVRSFFEEQKPVASICHGPWMLVEADVVRGRKVTSYPSLKTDLENAGAQWVDEEVVVDQGLVTSRNPDDLEPFKAKMIEEFCEGKHEGQAVESTEEYRERSDGGERPMA
jgi:protease I